jgi:hypothetical protein
MTRFNMRRLVLFMVGMAITTPVVGSAQDFGAPSTALSDAGMWKVPGPVAWDAIGPRPHPVSLNYSQAVAR